MFQIAMVWIATLMIGALRSTGEAGIYTAATRYLLVGTFATVALSQVFGPKISELTALEDHDAAQAVYQGTTAWYVVLTWPLYLTLAIFAPFLVSIFGREFLPGADPLLILALTMLVATACGPVDVVLLMAGKSSWNLGNTVIALVINIGLSLLLIPRLGITGAAIAWAASILTNNLLPLAQSWRYLHLHPVGRGFPRAVVAAAGTYGCLGLLLRAWLGPTAAAFVVYAVVATIAYGWLLWRFRETLDVHSISMRSAGARIAGQRRPPRSTPSG